MQMLGGNNAGSANQQNGQGQQGSQQPKQKATWNTAQSLPDDSFDDCPFAPIAKQYRSLINCM